MQQPDTQPSMSSSSVSSRGQRTFQQPPRGPRPTQPTQPAHQQRGGRGGGARGGARGRGGGGHGRGGPRHFRDSKQPPREPRGPAAVDPRPASALSGFAAVARAAPPAPPARAPAPAPAPAAPAPAPRVDVPPEVQGRVIRTLMAASDAESVEDPWCELVVGVASQNATAAAHYLCTLLRSPEGKISASAAHRLGEELADRAPCDLVVVEARLRRALASRFDEAAWAVVAENWNATAPSDPAQIRSFVEAVAAAVFGELWRHARARGGSRFRLRRNGPWYAPRNVHSQREGAELRPNALANAVAWSREEWVQHIRHTLEVLRCAPRGVRDVLVPLVQLFLDRSSVENRSHYVGVGDVAAQLYVRADTTWVVRPQRAQPLQVLDALAPALAVAESQPEQQPQPEPQSQPVRAVRIVFASSQWGGADRPITASEHEPVEAAPDQPAGNWDDEDDEDVSDEAMAERLARPETDGTSGG